MTVFDNILRNTKNLNQTEILVKVLNLDNVKAFIIDLNTEKQLALGLDSETGSTDARRAPKPLGLDPIQ